MQAKINIAEQIEAMIDQASVLDVLTALEIVCGEKADHIRANWQDKVLANAWDRASKVCGTAARHASIRALP